MYRRYCRGDKHWSDGLQCTNDFIAGALARHVNTWTRYGQLGVQDNINCAELCARLPILIDKLGAFGLLIEDGTVRLLVLQVGEPDCAVALCYGPWPGVDAWSRLVEPNLSFGVSLPHTFWNRMPRLDDICAKNPLDDTASAALATSHVRRHLDAA